MRDRGGVATHCAIKRRLSRGSKTQIGETPWPHVRFERLSEALARYLSGLCAHALQKPGLIQYSRGRIKILNRDGLKESACECCEVIREHVDKTVPPLT